MAVLTKERPDDRQRPCGGANVLSIVSSRDVDMEKELKLAADFLLKQQERLAIVSLQRTRRADTIRGEGP